MTFQAQKHCNWISNFSRTTIGCQSVKVSKCQTAAKVSFWALINNIFKIYYLLAGIFVARNEFDTLTLWHLDTFELFRMLNINQLQGSPMYSKSNSTSFLVKKWSRWWSKKPTFRSFSHSFWSPFIHLRSLRFADSWLKFGENRCARCDFFTKSDKYGQIRMGPIFYVVSLHRQNWMTRPSCSLTDTYKSP